MEVVLLWLDDLDDALFSLALEWERLRQLVLKVGLVASFGLAASDSFAPTAGWAPAFFYVAATSVGAWVLAVILRAYYDSEPGRISAVP